MVKNIDVQENNHNNLYTENTENELSPLKRNIIRIISAFLFVLLIWGTVCITDSLTTFITTLFK